jgi:hypothetical protein
MSKEIIFPDGFIVKRNPNAPEWVIANVSIKVDEFTKFLAENDKKGWVNIEIKLSKEGKPYGQLDTWEPNKDEAPKKNVVQKKEVEEDPF